MPIPPTPYRNSYGEWQLYFTERIKQKIVDSNRDYLGQFEDGDVTLGRFMVGLNSPHIYIVHARHNTEGANVSGGKPHGQFQYDVIVETAYPGDLDRAERDSLLIIGDIISELHLDPHLLDESGNWTCRGIMLEFLEPVYPLDATTKDLLVQAGLRVTILKSLMLT